MASTAWTCDCGRRVPPYIVTCRCGAKRPGDAAGVPDSSASARPNRPVAARPPASTPPPAAAPRPPAAAPRPPEPPAPPPPPPARPATVLRTPTTLRPPSSRAVPAIPALAPTPMPLRAPAPLPPLREATGEPRELGFRIKPKARPVRRIQDLPPWAQKVLIGVGVVAFYFAARALNRFRVSFGARDVAIEALIPLLGVDAAQKEAARQHGACFDKAYRTGWVKWQDYSFDERKHADCVMRGVMADFQQRTRDAAAAARKAEAARQPPVVASATTPRPPPPPPTPPPILSRVAVGNVQVLRMARSPQIGGRVSFVAIGNPEALASVAMCSYAVTCGGQRVGLPVGQAALAPCPLKVQGASATGDLEFSVLAPAPEGACSMELTLTDGTRPRSSTVVVPLP